MMKSVRGVAIATSMNCMIRLAYTSPCTCVQRHKTHYSVGLTPIRQFSIGVTNMVDSKRVINYEDVVKGIQNPNKVIIDVRNPDEVSSTGKIPSSINIPLGHVESALTSMSETDFQKYYQRSKPKPSTELIFYCRSGRRSMEALDKALKLGYSNSKSYIGSWEDWSSKTKN